MTPCRTKPLFSIAYLALILLLGLCPAHAQDALHSPPKGSPERKAIMDALRLPVEKELKQKLTFVTHRLKVQDGWAFLSGRPQQLSGKPVDYSITKHAEMVAEGMFDDGIVALLRKKGNAWRVVVYEIGCTDVCYEDWWQKYNAPKAIFE